MGMTIPVDPTGAFYVLADPGFGRVFSQSWELGGYNAALTGVIDDIVSGVGVPRCIRVDMFQAVQSTSTGLIELTWSSAFTGDWANLKLEVQYSCNGTPVTVTLTIDPCYWMNGICSGLGCSTVCVPGTPYTFAPPCEGPYNFTLQSECLPGDYYSGESTATVEWARPYKRGDSNRDGGFDIGDAVHVLDALFAGGEFPCRAASDVNADGAVDIGDTIYALNALFALGTPPPDPHEECGVDPEMPGEIECDEYDACE